MTKIGRWVRWVAVGIMLAISVALFLVTNKISNANICTDSILVCVKEITREYRIRQIIVTFIFFSLGFLVSIRVFGTDDIAYATVWAMPVSVAVWSVGSMVLLLTGIPYIVLSSVIIYIFLLALIRFSSYKHIEAIPIEHVLQIMLFALAVIVIISTGIIPTIMSSDSYFYVMQYGEILAKTGKLSFDTAGTFMTWTGISSALMSSLAYMFGFETIITFHYLLIFSMVGLFALTIFKYCKKCVLLQKPVVAIAVTIVSLLALISIPSIELLSSWVISNAHCMVYILFFMIGIKGYVDERADNNALFWILIFIAVWLGMSRAEMSVCMVGMIGISSCLSLKRRDLLIMSGLLLLFQGAFLLRLDVQQAHSNKQVYDTMLTTEIQLLMMGALGALLLYSVFYDLKLIVIIRDKLKVLILIALPLMCLCIYFIDTEKYVTSIDAIIYNLKNEYWGIAHYFLLVIVLVAIIITKRITFYGLFAYGYLFLNLLFALARKQPLRYGYGDSFNRMLISSVPIVLLAVVLALIENICNGRMIHEKTT